ncbi:glycosyltransferase family 2 protein [Patescibacteria group bacterium]|nr:glycosyltransferase family 2 protein [Patescibacteria group bacterium]
MISIVIPNYNSGELLKKNLPKLVEILKKTELDFEIIVSDDCSTDESLNILRNFSHLSNLRILSSETNIGFGGNVDRGIRAAKGEIVFILNAIDALPEKPDYFQLMLAHFEDPKIFSVAAAKKDEMIHGCGEVYFRKGFYLHRHKENSQFTDWADGGAQAIRKEYYLKIGGFDPIYNFYWEDVDLGFRARQAGYKIIYEPKAVLIHRKEEGPIARRYSEKERYVMNLRNQFIFTWKNADWKHLLLYDLWEPYYLLIAIKNRNWLWFKAYAQAFWRWPEIVRKRWEQKKLTIAK